MVFYVGTVLYIPNSPSEGRSIGNANRLHTLITLPTHLHALRVTQNIDAFFDDGTSQYKIHALPFTGLTGGERGGVGGKVVIALHALM